MKKTLLVLALLASFGVHAQDSNSTSSGNASSSANNAPVINTNPQITSGNSQSSVDVGASSSSNPNNAQNIVFNSTSGGASTMDQTQRVTGGTNNVNRNINEGTSTVLQEVRYSGTQTIKSAPGIQMSGPASGPCTGQSGGIGISGPGWGVGLNGSGVMDDCRIRENTRVLGMAMQSLDGNVNPQEKAAATVMFMDAVRGLAAYNNQIVSGAIKQEKK